AAPLPTELAAHDGPVALFFGLLRPYKGLDLLLRAWEEVTGAELWIVGMPQMDVRALRGSSPAGGGWAHRFVSRGGLRGRMERASLAVLPYREIDQSGVAFTALGAGLPSLLSDVGGFPELAATGAAATFPAGDAHALSAELRRLLAAPGTLGEMSAAAA